MTEVSVSTIAARLLTYLERREDRSQKVVAFASPAELEQAFAAAGVPLALMAGAPASSPEALLAAVEQTLHASVHTGHPRFFNQNFAGADPLAIAGDWLGAAVHTTAATYEMAPVFTLMERALITRLSELAGLPGAEGIFCPGGSLSNLHALVLARDRAVPHARSQGVGDARLVAFTSAHAHYSFEKAMSVAGLGRDNLCVVACDSQGRMSPEALNSEIERARAAGLNAFFVNATVGTTVVGAIDPLPEIAEVAQRHNLWMHVDGCHGASLLFSPTHRHRVAGVEQADSLSWNLHKMMGLTQQCAALLVRRRGALAGSFATGAAYLFQREKNHRALDLGDLSFTCARRVDSFKLWLCWKAYGDAGFAARIDRVMALADHLQNRLAADPRFLLAYPRSCSNLCFWWVPPGLRPLVHHPKHASASVRTTLARLAPAIKDRLQREGSLMLGFQAIDDLPHFFRLLVLNPRVTTDDLDHALELLDRHGTAVAQSHGCA